MKTILIFLGAGLGGVLRFWVSNGIYSLFGREFPSGTLFVNVSGCFLMGLLTAILIEHFNNAAPDLRALLLVGFLGGYTTFSSFAIETLNLFENGTHISALLNIFLSLVLCIMAAGIGVIGGKQI